MKLLEGFTLIELTEDRIVMEERFGTNGVIRVIGNPNPPPDKHQEMIDNVADLLRVGEERRLKREGVGA